MGRSGPSKVTFILSHNNYVHNIITFIMCILCNTVTWGEI